MDSKTNNNPNKLRGNAMIALRAYIYALTARDGKRAEDEVYRYEINDAANSARILVTATGATAEGYERSLDEWSRDGKKIRLAFIGLKDAKIVLDDEAKQSKGAVTYTRYSLDVLAGVATISRNGENIEGKPATIDEWAKIGRDIEKPMFEALKAAQQFGSADGEREYREKMIARGIIRKPREDNGRTSA